MTVLPQCQAVGLSVRDHRHPVPVLTRCTEEATEVVVVRVTVDFADRWQIDRDPRQIAVCADHLRQLRDGKIVQRIIGETSAWLSRPIIEPIVIDS